VYAKILNFQMYAIFAYRTRICLFAQNESCSKREPANDLYRHFMLGCAYEQKAYGQQWGQLIGVANKNAVFATFAGLTKRFEVQCSKFFGDIEVFVLLMSRSDA
jgi:hypothetical protein